MRKHTFQTDPLHLAPHHFRSILLRSLLQVTTMVAIIEEMVNEIEDEGGETILTTDSLENPDSFRNYLITRTLEANDEEMDLYYSCLQHIHCLSKLGDVDELKPLRNSMAVLYRLSIKTLNIWIQTKDFVHPGDDHYDLICREYERGVYSYLITLKKDFLEKQYLGWKTQVKHELDEKNHSIIKLNEELTSMTEYSDALKRQTVRLVEHWETEKSKCADQLLRRSNDLADEKIYSAFLERKCTDLRAEKAKQADALFSKDQEITNLVVLFNEKNLEIEDSNMILSEEIYTVRKQLLAEKMGEDSGKMDVGIAIIITILHLFALLLATVLHGLYKLAMFNPLIATLFWCYSFSLMKEEKSLFSMIEWSSSCIHLGVTVFEMYFKDESKEVPFFVSVIGITSIVIGSVFSLINTYKMFVRWANKD